MICAYDKLYIENAQRVLATMFDYAVNTLCISLQHMCELFVSSRYASSFERGNPSIVAGKSGIELALLVLEDAGENYEYIEPEYHLERTPEYWSVDLISCWSDSSLSKHIALTKSEC